jgi:hypothetical protein
MPASFSIKFGDCDSTTRGKLQQTFGDYAMSIVYCLPFAGTMLSECRTLLLLLLYSQHAPLQ